MTSTRQLLERNQVPHRRSSPVAEWMAAPHSNRWATLWTSNEGGVHVAGQVLREPLGRHRHQHNNTRSRTRLDCVHIQILRRQGPSM